MYFIPNVILRFIPYFYTGLSTGILLLLWGLKNAEKHKIFTMLTSVNLFAFSSEILYLCITEVEIAHEIRVISTFFVPKKPFFWSKNKLPTFFKVKQPVFNVTYSAPYNRYRISTQHPDC